MSHGGPSQRQASGTNKLLKALHQDQHLALDLTRRRAIKKETIAINHD